MRVRAFVQCNASFGSGHTAAGHLFSLDCLRSSWHLSGRFMQNATTTRVIDSRASVAQSMEMEWAALDGIDCAITKYNVPAMSSEKPQAGHRLHFRCDTVSFAAAEGRDSVTSSPIQQHIVIECVKEYAIFFLYRCQAGRNVVVRAVSHLAASTEYPE